MYSLPYDSYYFTFPKEFKKQCSCNSQENVYYLCTYQECEKFGLICPLCMFYKHSTHADYCIPIQLYKIKELKNDSINYLNKIKAYLMKKKEEIIKIFDSQIELIKLLQTTKSIEKNLDFDILPRYSQPPKILFQHIVEDKAFLDNINTFIRTKIKNLQSKVEDINFDLKSFFMNGKLVQIFDKNPIKFDELSLDKPFELKFSFKSKEPFKLKGIGYSVKISKDLNSFGYISIQEVQSKNYVLKSQLASNQHKSSFVPDVTVILFKPTKILKDLEYLVTVDYQYPNLTNVPKKVFWLGNLKSNSMVFNISAENQVTYKYVSHLWIVE